MASRTSSSNAVTARDATALWSLVCGSAGVVAMPLAVYLTRFVGAYQLRDSWVGIPLAAGLGIAAVLLARQARRRNAMLLGRGGGTGVARAGRILGVVAICMASAAIVAFAVLGLLEYVGSRN